MKRFLLVCYLLPVLSTAAISQQTATVDSFLNRTLTKGQMQQDFKFLQRIFEETHPGLYRYTSQPVMQRKMDSIHNWLNRPMPFYDYYRVLAAFIADIRCAHTYAIPFKNIEESFMNNLNTLPFEIMVLNDKLYITLNGTTDTLIKPGFEILSINGKAAGSLIQDLYDHVWSDGYILSSKTNIISGIKFPLFYYALVEQPGSFDLRLRKPDSTITQQKIAAARFSDSYKQFFSNPVNKEILDKYNKKNEKDRQQGWRTELLDAPSTALLRINGFGGGNSSKEAAEIIRKFLDSSMTNLQKQKVRNLVVDLRNNGGGWDIQGVELFSYLTKDSTAVPYYRRKHSITDSSEFLRYSDLGAEDRANIKKQLKKEDDGTFSQRIEFSDDMQLHPPKQNRFRGNIYFLINGGSASTTSEFTAVAYSNKLGVFIGEEAGGAYEGGNGGSFLHFDLPNSGISVGSPLLYYTNAVDKPIEKGRGTIPHYAVPVTIDDFLTANDPQLNFTLKLIREKEKKN